jgi:NTE family protein
MRPVAGPVAGIRRKPLSWGLRTSRGKFSVRRVPRSSVHRTQGIRDRPTEAQIVRSAARAARDPVPGRSPAPAGPSPTIGLALGSGGARGLAHIGVIEVLEEHGYSIGFVAGSSIGALVGGFYASGIDCVGLRRIASDVTWRSVVTLFDPSLRRGPVKGTRLQRLIQEEVGGRRVEDCSIPLAVVATHLGSGETVIFREGDLALVVRASVSVPWVFRPVQIDGRYLADGGVSLPVPAEPVRDMGADVVIAVDLDWERPLTDPSNDREPGPRQMANASIAILRRHLAAQDARYADVVVRPRFGREVKWDGFLDPDDLIGCGRAAMIAEMTALESAIAAWTGSDPLRRTRPPAGTSRPHP